jgi:hypothetical protein
MLVNSSETTEPRMSRMLIKDVRSGHISFVLLLTAWASSLGRGASSYRELKINLPNFSGPHACPP